MFHKIYFHSKTKSKISFQNEHTDLIGIWCSFTVAHTQEIQSHCLSVMIRFPKDSRSESAVTRSLLVQAAAWESSLLHPPCAWIKQTVLHRCQFLHTVPHCFTDDLSWCLNTDSEEVELNISQALSQLLDDASCWCKFENESVCSEAVIWPWDNTRLSVYFLPWHIWFNATLSSTRAINKAQQENTELWAKFSADAKPNGHFNASITRRLFLHYCNCSSGFKAPGLKCFKKIFDTLS